MKLEIHERNNLLKIIEVFGTKDKLTVSQSDCLLDILDIIKRDIKNAANRPEDLKVMNNEE